MSGPSGTRRRARAVVAALALAGLAAGAVGAGPEDDRTFRPTVIVRRGDAQGSGTVVASVAGETLVLTAAHVVQGSGAVEVELHRFNLGLERSLPAEGWPVRLPGAVAAADPAGDVAVVRVAGRRALPFVARLAAVGDEPGPGAVVTSIGVDGGARLDGWPTRVRGVSWFAMGAGPEGPAAVDPGRPPARGRAGARPDPALAERPFLITDRAPEPGRSGGGLFLDDGRLAGVCVGRIDGGRGRPRARGVFAAPETVRRLLRDHDLEAAVARPAPAQRGRSDHPSSK